MYDTFSGAPSSHVDEMQRTGGAIFISVVGEMQKSVYLGRAQGTWTVSGWDWTGFCHSAERGGAGKERAYPFHIATAYRVYLSRSNTLSKRKTTTKDNGVNFTQT